MENLPLEIVQNILLTAPAEELTSLCSVSKNFYDLCSSRAFWVQRFRDDNLPMLRQGTDFSSWYRIYMNSLNAKEEAQQDIDEIRNGKIYTLPLPIDPSVIQIKEISGRTLQEFIDIAERIREEEEEYNNLYEEYKYDLAEAQQTGESSERLDEIREMLSELAEAEGGEAYLKIYQHEGSFFYRLYAIREDEIKKVTVTIPLDELENLFYRINFFGL